MPNLKAKIDGHNKKILEKNHLQKQNHATVWKNEIAQREESAWLKIF